MNSHLKVITFTTRPAEHPLVTEARNLSQLLAVEPDAAAGIASLIRQTLRHCVTASHQNIGKPVVDLTHDDGEGA